MPPLNLLPDHSAAAPPPRALPNPKPSAPKP
uniref:Uncharacterized protein n=1 Tax=Arundo donax TaxID=35708 RepID=A0A0A9CAB1_ARUDO